MAYTGAPEWGKKYDQGMNLAVAEINAAGGVLGRPLEFIRRDTQLDAGHTIREVEELALRENVEIFTGTLAGNVASAVSEYADKNNKLFLATIICSDNLVWENGNAMTFKLHPPCSNLGRMLAEEAAKLPAQRWAFVGFYSAYNNEVLAGFNERLKELGKHIEWVDEQWTTIFKLDAGSVINSIRQSKPDAVLNLLVTQDQQAFIRYGNTVGFFDEVDVVMSPNFGLPEEYGPVPIGDVPVGWVSGVYPYREINIPEHQAFVERFLEKYRDQPYYTSLLAYINVYAIAAAIKNAGSDNAIDVAKAMRGMTFDSPVGEVKFRNIDQQADLGFWIGKVDKTGDKVVILDWSYKQGDQYYPTRDVIEKLRNRTSN
ncbi:MAG: ABC transporter substrate-binding protein [Gammaproteobacteria bacterium]|nr:ABC transporter substrate-binding protein [Gammaproteobacteria bacterium]